MLNARKRGRSGVATSSVEYSPERLRRMHAAMTRTETRWAKMAGPVTVRPIAGAEQPIGTDGTRA